MAETLCTLRTKGGGGGRYKETSLWTNPNPTTAISSALTVTLSDSVDNYKYIKLLYRYSTSDATEYSMIYATDVFKQCQQGTYKAPIVGFTEQATDGSMYARQAYYVNTTSVKFGGSCYLLGSTSKDSTKSIPTEILGLNELAHGKKLDETTLWTNASPTSSFAQQNITLSDSISNYDYVRIYFRASTTNSAEKSIIFPVNEISDNKNAFGGKFTGFNNTTVRGWTMDSETSFTIYLSYQLTQASQTASATTIIPTKITGIVVQ